MSEGNEKWNGFEENKTGDFKLTADEQKIMKQLEAGKQIEDSTIREEIHITGEKYKWFLDHLYDIDPKLGLIWKDYDQISKQRNTVFHLLKEMGSNLFKGKSIMSVSLPITIMEPKSMLQRLADIYVYLPLFAKKMYDEKDPVERMKWYVGYSIAALYQNLAQVKPLNPIWGETYEGYLGSPDFKIYCEQISHHPPISQVQIDCPYLTLYGTHYVEASTYPNSIKVRSLGKHVVILKDEEKTTIELVKRPNVLVEGLVVGKRTMSYIDTLEIEDKTNGIYAQGRFNPEKQGLLEKIFNKTKFTRPDFFKGFITKNKGLLEDASRKAFYSKDMISYFEGQWLEFLVIDGESYWDLEKNRPVINYGIKNPLPSDSVNRADLGPLTEGKLETAQKEKEALEDVQRGDRKLRAEFRRKAKNKG
eukprot:TRINITY_DN7984_c0_g1_i17.p1 TRINITY_DN7984_c0_g1~~TRINITY_DN7984_c0_g1_i17.p1  ORF type:complete len:419 (+),score=105.35 TRINITY_DN7984_c0_g1_i17:198-1454(+)